MPIYEYRCKGCGHEFEEWQKITDKPVRTCPRCRKRKVERLVSMTSFQLKGGGWYVTDYSGKKNSASSKNGTSTDTSKGEESKEKKSKASSKKKTASPAKDAPA